MESEIDRWMSGISNNVDVLPDHCGEETAELEVKALDLLVDFCSNPHHMVMNDYTQLKWASSVGWLGLALEIE